MKNTIKLFGLLAAIAMIPGAFAATSRASVTGKTASRLPSIAGHIVSGTTTTTTTTSSTASYLDNTECIDKYTDCIKADDACGSDMSECTTKVLFHGQMAKCLSVLYQCSSSGVNALFGTSSISALSAGETRNTSGDIVGYTYPLDGSVLGQLIIGAGISNRLNTEQCIKSYTRCLQREDNCGSDFELCTTKKEFKKQALLCDSTLQRCDSTGKTQLFGSVSNADSLNPADSSRIGTMIENGQQLAAMNAVKTCQKVTDNCLINACTKNPLRCVEGTSMAAISAADFLTGSNELAGLTSTTQTIGQGTGYTENYLESLTGSDVRKMFKSQCLETIGANKYCHMTYREKSPSNKDLFDIDLQEDVFSLAYAARKDVANTKIQENLKKFDTRAKDACYETIKSCAMRSCGGGLGSVCYRLSGNGTTGIHVNSTATYGDIKSGCAAIINADANCIYAATSSDTEGYSYTYYDDNDANSAFARLFPEYTGTESDPIGAIGKLNSLLATSYNDAAIENMKKQCQTVALSCVKSMCGKDYVNCYRNRTDIISGTYDTGNGNLDRSMNKMGGILDYNIVIGLCMNNVKTSPVCEEHLKVATATWRNSQDADSWGTNNTVRDAWLGANTTTVDTNAASNNVVIACMSSNCNDGNTREPVNGACPGEVDEDGCIYDTPVTQSQSEYALTNGATTLFQTLLVDVEKEVQAKYNAKLTKEQNVCLSNNNGGIMGSASNGSTFMWAKLKGNKVPKNYAQKGLQTKEFMASNDLYGSFCRVKVTVMSDDKYIQDNLGADSTAYFAVGDSFTCGSWISQKTLETISEKVGEQARKDAGEGSKRAKWTQGFASAVPALVAGLGSVALVDKVQKNGGSLGGLLSNDSRKAQDTREKAADSCLKNIDSARNYYYSSANEPDKATQAAYYQTALKYANTARRYARNADATLPDNAFAMGKYTEDIDTLETIEGRDAIEAVDIYGWDPEDKKLIDTSMNTLEANVCCGSVCQSKLREATSLLAGDKTAENANKIKDAILAARNACLTNSQRTESGECKTKEYNECINVSVPDAPKTVLTYHRDGVDAIEARTIGTKTAGQSITESSEYKAFPEALKNLEKACEDAKKSNTNEGKSGTGAKIALGATSAVLAGLAGFSITKAAQNAKYEKAEDEAVKAWMEEIGDHIQCYVGTEEVGTYGDVIGIEIN